MHFRSRSAAGPAAAGAIIALAVVTAAPAWGGTDAFVLSSDFSTSYYSKMNLPSPYTHVDNIASTCGDAVVRAREGRYYVLGRSSCNYVQVVDGNNYATLNQYSTGAGTNPQDIVVCSPIKAYVSLYETNFLTILNPQTGAALGTIDLSPFADADGLPEASGMARVGDRVFVALQRLDRPSGFSAANPSLVVVIDATTDQVVDADAVTPGVQGITLTGRNPFTDISLDPVRQKLVVGEVGNFGVLDGGVEYVNPVTLQAEGFLVTENALGGDLNAVKLWTDCTGYAIVNDASFRTKLVRFNACTGQSLGTCLQSAGFDLSDIEIDYARGQVLVADRDFITPGVRVLQAGTCTQLTASPINFGLPPYDLALAAATPASTPAPSSPALRITNAPDPFNPTTVLHLKSGLAGLARVDIVDAGGRRRRSLWSGTLPAGGRELLWDGRDDAGRALPSGAYWARVRQAGAMRTDRMTLVR